MAKNKSKSGKKRKSEAKQDSPSSKSPWYWHKKWHLAIIFFFSFFLYVNTLGHDYTQDDAIVIYDNMFTQEGFSGIPGILNNDTFYGFFKEEGKAKLVSGGRYRPFTLIMFAIEWELFGRNPMIGHLVNILLYACLGMMIYLLLRQMFLNTSANKKLIALTLLASLLYVAHPIHTEAVANIKGRDEIMSMLGSILALWALFKHKKKASVKYLVLALTSFFIALMSKENAITFLAIAPAAFMLFSGHSFIKAMRRSWPLFASAALFLLIRFSILGMDFGGTPGELMNNPFLKFVNNTYIPFSGHEKLATILFTLGKYVQLMIFPHPLSHDYYPRAIDIMYFSNWKVILSLLVHIAMVAGVFYFWKRDRFISFGLFFYLASLSIVSNIVFPIGTNMSERFLFMPSLGFLIVIARILLRFIPSLKLLGVISMVLILGLGARTIDRNGIWKNDFTLFTTDVKNNPESAKLLNAAGGALTTRAANMADGPERTADLRKAIGYLTKAVEIHPTYRNAYLLLGNAHYYLGEYEQSISYFDKVLSIDPNFGDALKNLPVVLRDGGRYMGQTMNNFNQARTWLERSFQMNPRDFETCRLLGITYGIQGNNQKAVEFFKKAVELRPDIAANYSSLGTAYMNAGETEKAREAFNKAVELDPNALQHLQN